MDTKVNLTEVKDSNVVEHVKTNNDQPSYVIKISKNTDAKAAAGSLAMVLKEHGFAEMLCIGAASVNQAVKAYTIASGHVKPVGMDIVMLSSFETTDIEGNEKTRIRLRVEPR